MMGKPVAAPESDLDRITLMPGWITSARSQTPEDAAFLSGAALAHLHRAAAAEGLPQALWRDRLALVAAEACVGFAGRREREAALRDALHLSRLGDELGPAGAVFEQWSRAAARPLSVASLERVLSGVAADRIAGWLDAGEGRLPVARAAAVLEAVLAESPRAETAALILADAALARVLGWDHLLPLLALGLAARDLRLGEVDLRLACHRALVSASVRAVRLAADLTRRAARLRDVAPTLRAKGADRAVELLLSRDALAPAALTGFMSDRAARRLCDRLVTLGAVRELTGRGIFRLYGL